MQATLLEVREQPVVTKEAPQIPASWQGRVRIQPTATFIKGYKIAVVLIEHAAEIIEMLTLYNTKIRLDLTNKGNPYTVGFMISGPGLPRRRNSEIIVGGIHIPIP